MKMTETASAQNRNYPGMTMTLPSGTVATGDSEGRFRDIPATDAEWLITTPGWSRIGEDPARHAMINPLGKRPPEVPTATELGDPLAKAHDLADHLLNLPPATTADDESSDDAGNEDADESQATGDDDKDVDPVKEDPAPSIEDMIKAAKKRGISIPKAVKANGDDAIRAYLDEANKR